MKSYEEPNRLETGEVQIRQRKAIRFATREIHSQPPFFCYSFHLTIIYIITPMTVLSQESRGVVEKHFFEQGEITSHIPIPISLTCSSLFLTHGVIRHLGTQPLWSTNKYKKIGFMRI